MVAQLKDAERQIAELKSQNLSTAINPILAKAHDMWGVSYIADHVPDVSAGDLRTLATQVRDRVQGQAAVVALIGGTAEKPSVVIATTDGARYRGLKAGDLVRVATQALGGRGGGRDDIAQGGGSDSSKIADALRDVEYAIGHTLQTG
jgi:alanyl-tRNA synthetase